MLIWGQFSGIYMEQSPMEKTPRLGGLSLFSDEHKKYLIICPKGLAHQSQRGPRCIPHLILMFRKLAIRIWKSLCPYPNCPFTCLPPCPQPPPPPHNTTTDGCVFYVLQWFVHYLCQSCNFVFYHEINNVVFMIFTFRSMQWTSHHGRLRSEVTRYGHWPLPQNATSSVAQIWLSHYTQATLVSGNALTP